MNLKKHFASIYLVLVFCLLSFNLQSHIQLHLIDSSSSVSFVKYADITFSTANFRAETLSHKHVSKENAFPVDYFSTTYKSILQQLDQSEKNIFYKSITIESFNSRSSLARAPPLFIS